MKRHFRVHPLDPPSRLPEPQAKIGFLACDEIVRIAACLDKRLHTKERISAAMQGSPNRDIPLVIADAIVDASLGKALSAPPEHGCQLAARAERFDRGRKPIFVYFAIAIDELYETQIPVDLEQVEPTGITGSCRRKAGTCVEFDNADADRVCKFDASVA